MNKWRDVGLSRLNPWGAHPQEGLVIDDRMACRITTNHASVELQYTAKKMPVTTRSMETCRSGSTTSVGRIGNQSGSQVHQNHASTEKTRRNSQIRELPSIRYNIAERSHAKEASLKGVIQRKMTLVTCHEGALSLPVETTTIHKSRQDENVHGRRS